MSNFGVMTGLLASLLGIDPLHIPGPVALLGFLLDIAVATFVVLVVWSGWRLFTSLVGELLEIQATRQRVVIARGLTRHDYDQVRRSIRGWHLLVVRYGTDDYLRNLAGAEDRHAGRPRYTTLPMRLSLSGSGEVVLSWSLPVHRRLGTQFRCYIDIRAPVAGGNSGPEVLMGMLKHYDEIEVLAPDVAEPTRLYFLLKRFAVIPGGEGVRQNLARPE
ncbi:MAG: hypothetical protein KGJ41_07590 [Rhodospirillales bacterium]|nr:hypothetical protein [Rhodospirillales bacterium]MDE2198869.1 hypothetical protein [Rhodospirillales bacterium]MDE2576249.1 hypothetical protein [Rhodospirillales bacterium]